MPKVSGASNRSVVDAVVKGKVKIWAQQRNIVF